MEELVKILMTLIITLSLNTAFALPVAPFDALKNVEINSIQAENISNQYDFEGIVKLSNCSGSLIAFSGQPITNKAIVMTNGHCIQKPGGYLEPKEVWVNKNLKRSLKIFDREMKLKSIDATKIIYATMTETDVAYYELSESYEEIFQRTGVRPFLLDSSRPFEGLSIDIISGYWDRGYSCEIDGFVHLIKEGDWTFTDSIRYTKGCDTIGGTSGSPIIARGERRVIGINNTSNESGQRCTINNPCEVNEAGDISARKGVRYGQQTYPIYPCLTMDFKLDLTKTDCKLPK